MAVRVAAYCRVSTDKDDQANSYESQQRYFREYINSQPDWQLAEIYADEGITGTNTRKRVRFNEMISDAHRGKFTLILTKEVSRFSRNILDTISYTRELKRIGIGVIFVTDRINTLDPEAEIMLSLLASMAQEESRKTSARVTWGQTRQMERGVVFGPSLLGFNVQNGQITVNQKEAETVRLIFHKYALEQMGTAAIAQFLTREGYKTGRGGCNWSSGSVIKILKNEKYVGDLIQRKTYTPDYLSHSKKKNAGQVPLIVCPNHHEPIVSRELWDLAQQKLSQNRNNKNADGGHSNRYIFSGKIICGECGNRFVGRTRKLGDGSRIRRWSCGNTVSGEGCTVGKLVRDDDAVAMLKTAIRMLDFDKPKIIGCVASLAMEAVLSDHCPPELRIQRMNDQLLAIKNKKDALVDGYLSGFVTGEELKRMREMYDQQYLSVQQKLDERTLEKQQRSKLSHEITDYLQSVLDGAVESNVFYKTMLHSLTVYADRSAELKLMYLPHVFRFQYDSEGNHLAQRQHLC